MTLPYNDELSKEQRVQFTERLIKLHTILGQDTTTEYRHQVWTQYTPYGFFKRLRTGQHCGTAACALGHALLHRDQFPGLPVFSFEDLAREMARVGNYDFQPFTPTAGSAAYFGPDAFTYIFSPLAYAVQANQVTRQMAMDRIEQYIREVLGCQLIEA